MSAVATHSIEDYESLRIVLQSEMGVIVSDDQRSCLMERVEPVLQQFDLASMAELATGLKSGYENNQGDLRSSLLDAISFRTTNWQLSAEMKNLFHQYILKQLPEKARIWVVGCGQGQLAYSIAIEIAEFEYNSGDNKQFEVMATDVLKSDIKFAEKGVYSKQQLLSLSDTYKGAYLVIDEANGTGSIKNNMKQLVHFSQCDLTENFQELGEIDLIICPEALVYFSNGVKHGIIDQFSEILKTGGILMTGNYQVGQVNNGLERVDHPEGVFFRQTD